MKSNLRSVFIAITLATCVALPALAAPAVKKLSSAVEQLPSVCTVGDIKLDTTSANSCVVFQGNDNPNSNPEAFMPPAGYTFLGKTDATNPVTGNVSLAPSGNIFLSLLADPNNEPAGDLLLSWTGGPALMDFYFVVKSANEHIAYNFVNYSLTPGKGFDDGTYQVAIQNKQGTAQALSHLSFYAQGTKIMEVPEPASLALLSIGFIGIGAARRLRKASKP